MQIFRNRPSTDGGFSLMEVVVAVAIVAVAAIPVLGLLGVAIESSREAFANVNNARIGAQLIGEIQQAGWSEASQWNGKEFYYDNEGLRIKDGTKDDAIYTAKVRIIATRSGVSLGSTSAASNLHLKQLLVAVSSRPGPLGSEDLQEAMNNPQNQFNNVEFYRSILVNTEK